MMHLDRTKGRSLALCLLLAASCGGDAATSTGQADDHDHGAEAESSAPRSVLLNDAVREALGLELRAAELRGLGPLLEFPGALEPAFGAMQVAAAPLDGRVEVMTRPLREVEAGALLFRLDAPAWRSLQSELAAVEAELEGHAAWLDEVEGLERAHRRHEEALSALEGRWSDRLVQLDAIREAGGGQAAALVDAQASLLDARARLAQAQEVGARLSVDRAERLASRGSAEARRRSLLARATTLTGVPVEELVGTEGEGRRWWTIERIEVRAQRAGRVLSIETANGAWAEAGDAVVRLRRRGAVQVKASVFQADLSRVTDGTPVRVRPAGIEGDEVDAVLRTGLAADARERSAEVYAFFSGPKAPTWARPGLSVVVSIPAPGPRVEVAAVWTEATSSEQTETLLTEPIEAALIGVRGVVGLASSSTASASEVEAQFGPGVALDEARARVAAALEGIGGPWPPGAAPSVSGAFGSARVAVPSASLRRDGADRVVWVENPERTMELIAVPVVVLEEGPEWTFIESPIEPGNRVVARGAGRLGLAAQGASQSGGHFHADGSFHAEDH